MYGYLMLALRGLWLIPGSNFTLRSVLYPPCFFTSMGADQDLQSERFLNSTPSFGECSWMSLEIQDELSCSNGYLNISPVSMELHQLGKTRWSKVIKLCFRSNVSLNNFPFSVF